MIKTRFAPSPTGVMHLGNLRTALVNALFAQGHGGQMLLRIEDTDKERSQEQYVDQIYEDLDWLNIPYERAQRQSERGAIYSQYFEQLIENQLAYPCFCTEQDLAIQRKADLSAGRPPRYSGKCAHLTSEQIQTQIENGLQPSLRFRVPSEKIIRFEDAIFGPKQFMSDDLGDFVIRKNDGGPTFMFCNAIDDALMGVTHAFRGEDHITNTPRQLMLLEALGLEGPIYGHFPIILGMDGKPLSKRNGSQSVKQLKEQGYLPAAIQNYVARLGHSYEQTAFLTPEELGKHYTLSRVGTAPAKFDLEQLNFWQDTSWRNISDKAVQDVFSAEATIVELVPQERWDDFVTIIKQNIRFVADAQQWAERLYTPVLDYDEPARAVFQEAGAVYFTEMAQLLDTEDPKTMLNSLKAKLEIKGKALFMPFRMALTGVHSGPTFDEIYTLMSKAQIQARIQNVCKYLDSNTP